MGISNLKYQLLSQKDQCIWMKRMIKTYLTKLDYYFRYIPGK